MSYFRYYKTSYEIFQMSHFETRNNQNPNCIHNKKLHSTFISLLSLLSAASGRCSLLLFSPFERMELVSSCVTILSKSSQMYFHQSFIAFGLIFILFFYAIAYTVNFRHESEYNYPQTWTHLKRKTYLNSNMFFLLKAWSSGSSASWDLKNRT